MTEAAGLDPQEIKAKLQETLETSNATVKLQEAATAPEAPLPLETVNAEAKVQEAAGSQAKGIKAALPEAPLEIGDAGAKVQEAAGSAPLNEGPPAPAEGAPDNQETVKNEVQNVENEVQNVKNEVRMIWSDSDFQRSAEESWEAVLAQRAAAAEDVERLEAHLEAEHAMKIATAAKGDGPALHDDDTPLLTYQIRSSHNQAGCIKETLVTK